MEQQENTAHGGPRELLRGPPPITTGRAPITTGAKLPSSYNQPSSRVIHNPRPICTVFPGVHSVQVRAAPNAGAPALTLSSTPAIRGNFMPASSSHSEQPDTFSPHASGSQQQPQPQSMHAARQQAEAQHPNGTSPRFSSPMAHQKGAPFRFQAEAASLNGDSQQKHSHLRPQNQQDAMSQQFHADANPVGHRQSLIEEYTGIHVPDSNTTSSPHQHKSQHDLQMHPEGLFTSSAPDKPYSSSMMMHHSNPGRPFSLRVGRICEDMAEGQDVAGPTLPASHANGAATGWNPMPYNGFRQNGNAHSSGSMPSMQGPATKAMPMHPASSLLSLDPDLLTDLDPPIPGMTRHSSNPVDAPTSQPLSGKSNSVPLGARQPSSRHPHSSRNPQWPKPSADITDSWLQDPSDLREAPLEPGMLTDPPLPYHASVPSHAEHPSQHPNPFAAPQPPHGPPGNAPSEPRQTLMRQQPTFLPPNQMPLHAGSFHASTDGQSPRSCTAFENGWVMGTGGNDYHSGQIGPNPFGHRGSNDKSSAYSSWGPAKQPSGTLTHLSHASHPDFTSYVSSQTDHQLDNPGFYLPTQDSNGPGNGSAYAPYAYEHGDTWGKNSICSAQHRNGPLEPDFWQPIDPEAEGPSRDQNGEPWDWKKLSLDSTSSLQLADLYTWLDNALENRTEDPAQPSALDPLLPTPPMDFSRPLDTHTNVSSPKPMSGLMSGNCSEYDESVNGHRSSLSGAGSKHKDSHLSDEPRSRSRRRLSIETNPFMAHAEDEFISIPRSEMQTRELEQQRLQQQVDEKQQACEILAMQLVDAQRRCQEAENQGLPTNAPLQTRSGDEAATSAT